MLTFSLDVDASNFNEVVVEGSKTAPVIADFWAPWCGPCLSLKPILEQLAEQYEGKFTLAKINVDENSALAQQYGVRGIPAVKAFVDGEVIEEFSGAMPEQAVRQFIETIVPSPGKKLYQEAMHAHATNDQHKALELLTLANELQPDDEDIRMALAQLKFEMGELEQAKALVDSVPDHKKDKYSGLAAKIEFAEKTKDVITTEAALKQVKADENNLTARLNLVNALVTEEDYEGAMIQLLEIIRRDRTFENDIGRKTLIKLFNLLDNKGELVAKYRRLMASLLN